MPGDESIHELSGAAAVPRRNGELVFDAPWQSRAFGMAVALHDRGTFRWDEFRDLLIAEIATHPSPQTSQSPAAVYYRQWLAALERLLVAKGIVAPGTLEARVHDFASGERNEVF